MNRVPVSIGISLLVLLASPSHAEIRNSGLSPDQHEVQNYLDLMQQLSSVGMLLGNGQVATGFLVNPQCGVTAAHASGVNTFTLGLKNYRISSWISMPGYNSGNFSSAADLAVFCFSSPIIEQQVKLLEILTADQIQIGQEFLFAGFGERGEVGFGIDDFAGTFNFGTNVLDSFSPDGKYGIFDMFSATSYNAGFTSGHSGGPIIFNGKIAGIASWIGGDVHTTNQLNGFTLFTQFQKDWVLSKASEGYEPHPIPSDEMKSIPETSSIFGIISFLGLFLLAKSKQK